jgi:chromate transporter
MLLPGPEAQQLATYIGWLLHGVRGGIAAGALFVLPSLCLLLVLSWIYVSFGHVPAIAAVLYGFKPAVVAIVIAAAHRIGSRVLSNATLWAIALLALVCIALLHVPFPVVVFGAGVIGWCGSRVAPTQFQPRMPVHSGESKVIVALIGDDVPPPEHARFNGLRIAVYGAVGLGMWLAAMGVLVFTLGWDNALTQMGWFFSKAALVTFGGAYAVLPYVQQAAVDQFAWLTPAQMIDGLALGETTPGPLIMVVSFIGFVGAWTQAPLGPDGVLIAAILGGIVATLFTFLPSFLFILLGGPAVEATRDDLKFTAPLTAITAAVVGVILNLALYFAYHVFFPGGWEGPVDWLAMVLCAAAAVALLRTQMNVVWVIAACALVGAMSKLILV